MPAKKAAAKKAVAPVKKAAVTKASANAALTRFQEQFGKAFGAGTLVQASKVDPYEVISTGSMLVDYALGVGGYVLGRLVEGWGPDAIGKTTFFLLGMIEAQKKFPLKRTGFIDMEHTFDRGLAEGLGVEMDRLDVFSPDSAEDVADAMKMMIASGLYSYIILDSVGAMIPEAEKEKDADQATVALQAKIVTRMVKIAAVEADKHGVVVILINQVRAIVGNTKGPSTTTGGGFALKHVTTHKLKFRGTGEAPYKVKRLDPFGQMEETVVGREIAIEIERNKVAPPKRLATINLMHQASEEYGPRGVNKVDEAATLGIMTGVIRKNGGWYTLPGVEGQINGEAKVRDALRESPEMIESVRSQALRRLADTIVTGIEAQIEIPEGDEGIVARLKNLDADMVEENPEAIAIIDAADKAGFFEDDDPGSAISKSMFQNGS